MDLSYMSSIVDLFSPLILAATLVCLLLAVKIIFMNGDE